MQNAYFLGFESSSKMFIPVSLPFDTWFLSESVFFGSDFRNLLAKNLHIGWILRDDEFFCFHDTTLNQENWPQRINVGPSVVNLQEG